MLQRLTRYGRLSLLKLTLLLMVACVVLVSHQLLLLPFTRVTRSTLKTPTWLKSHEEEGGHCAPHSNVAFLKTHKCASSAISNILFRYGLTHRLHFVLPSIGNYLGGLVSFNRFMVENTIWHRLGYNIFTVHTKWNHEEVAAVMPPDSVFVSIVREPAQLFESLYSFARMDKMTNKSLNEYVASVDVGSPRLRSTTRLGYNQMTWDFGTPQEHMNNLTAVQTMLDEALDHFDLVMVAERMEESLVLLAHLLCWDLKDVLVLKINAREDKHKKQLDSNSLQTLRTKLAPDYMLYEAFNRRFSQLVSDFGTKRMQSQVSRLRHLTQELQQECHFSRVVATKIRGANRPWSEMVEGYNSGNGTNATNSMCKDFIRTELHFIDIIRGRQKVDAMMKFGYTGSNDLNSLPLGSQVLTGGRDMKANIEKLKGMLIYKEGEKDVESKVQTKVKEPFVS